MDQEGLEQRIAELESRLADAEAAAREERRAGRRVQSAAAQQIADQGVVDEHARRLTRALKRDRRSVPETAQLREALRRAVVDAGLTEDQYKDTLQRAGLHAGGTVKIGREVVYQRCDPSDPVHLAPGGRQAFGAREFLGANHFGAIIAAIGGVIGLSVGTAAAITAVIPSSALWMSGIVCISGYHLAYNTSTRVDFQCVNGDSSYGVNDLAIFGAQPVLAALVLCAGLAVVGLIRARLRKP